MPLWINANGGLLRERCRCKVAVSAAYIKYRLRQLKLGVEARFSCAQQCAEGGQLAQVAGKQVVSHTADSKAGRMLILQQALQDLFVAGGNAVWCKMRSQLGPGPPVRLGVGQNFEHCCTQGSRVARRRV